MNIGGAKMWSHRIVASSDADEFVTLIRPDGCEILVTERGQFNARSILMDVGRLYLQRRCEDLSRLIQVNMPRPGILFLTEPGPSMFLNGSEIGYDHLALFSAGNGYLSRLSGPTRWGGMTLADEDMETICASHFGCDAKWKNDCTVIIPPPAALTALRSLHAAAGDLAEASAQPSLASASALEQALIETMLQCIDLAGARADTTALQHHRIVIRRFREMLEANPSEPLHMSQISEAIGVSGRTLRMASQQLFGVSPTQYLLLRRMRLARRTLRYADPAVTTVTDIATDLGFWELGRFSVRYRQIFGETPSATLRAAGFGGHQSMPSEYAFA
jgi:AraC-like DNA-binding protein